MNRKMKNGFLFTFLVLVLISSGCRDSSVTGSADDNQAIAQVEEMGEFISPAAGDIWLRGSTHTIEWKDFAPEYNVHLVLLKKKKYYPVEILTDAPNTGTHTWRVPESIVPSSYYQLKLINSSSPEHFIFSRPFVIR